MFGAQLLPVVGLPGLLRIAALHVMRYGTILILLFTQSIQHCYYNVDCYDGYHYCDAYAFHISYLHLYNMKYT